MTESGKVILIGGGGMIGHRLISELTHEVVVTSSREGVAHYTLDLSNFRENDLRFIKEGDTVLLAAAVSSPDICMRNPKYARAVNVIGTKGLISYCLGIRARVIFFSSDTVYGAGSTEKPVAEDKPLIPFGDYAGMKAEIEEFFRDTEGFLALRLSYIVSAQDKFSRYLQECVIKGRNAEIFHPLYRNAVWIGDLITVISLFVNSWPDSLHALNVGSTALVSRVDMAESFSEGCKKKLNYDVVRPDASFYEARPEVIAMNTDCLAKYLGRQPYTLETAYRNEFKNIG